jgi:YD repeat-containing protein
LLQKVSYSANSKREYGYDNADRVSNITNTIGSNSKSYDYGYDANSNRNAETKKTDNQVSRNLEYQYDEVDRLKQVKTITPNGQNAAVTNQLDYTYDAVGNRKTEVGTDLNNQAVYRIADYDDLNQLSTLFERGSGTSNFSYDNNGNLTE